MQVVNQNFFSSILTGDKLSAEYELNQTLPRMIPREGFLEVFNEAQETVKITI